MFQAHGVKGQRSLIIIKWPIICKTINFVYRHVTISQNREADSILYCRQEMIVFERILNQALFQCS